MSAGAVRVLSAQLAPGPAVLRRKCDCGGSGHQCEECKKKSLLQRQASGGGGPRLAPPIVHEVLRSPGKPLDPATRADMEAAFGHDFSRVRVHSGVRAAESARQVSARAYTVGRAIVLGAGQPSPGSIEGRRLLAHELAHTVQQEGRASSGPLEIGPVDSAQEQEADTSARAVAGDPASTVARRSGPAAGAAGQSGRAGLTPAPAVLQRACPSAPTGVAATKPSPYPCEDRGPEGVAGDIFYFCNDSTDLLDGQGSQLAAFASEARRATAIEIHGNASTEGPGGYNRSLGCMRAMVFAERLRGIGVSPRPTLVSHGETRIYGAPQLNRNVVVRLTLPPRATRKRKAEPSTRRDIPNSDFNPSGEHCTAYLNREVEEYLGTYLQRNANAACRRTPDEPHNNCVRHCLQEKLGSFIGQLKAEGRAKASETRLPAQEGIGRCRTIWKHHVDCYRDCGCDNAFIAFRHFFPMCDQPFSEEFVQFSIGRWNPCMGPKTTPWVPPWTEP